MKSAAMAFAALNSQSLVLSCAFVAGASIIAIVVVIVALSGRRYSVSLTAGTTHIKLTPPPETIEHEGDRKSAPRD